MNSTFFIYRNILLVIFVIIGLFYSVRSAAQAEIDPEYAEYIIDSVVVTGNKITRDQVIYREMVIKSGDTVPSDELGLLIGRSRENLVNTLLFNFVEISGQNASTGNEHLVIRVSVIERWYIWPIPILKISDRNFNVWWETKDFSRLSYGMFVDWRNFRGRRESLIFRFQYGFDRLFDIQYVIPYLNQRKTVGIGFGGGIWRQKESAARTEFNKQVFFEDPDNFARQDIFGYAQFLVRRNIYNSHIFELRYDNHHFSDSLLGQNENFSVNQENDIQYLSFKYQFKSDHRDYKSYPLRGYYADVELVKYGLFTFSQNTLNTFHLQATFRKFWELHPRIYFASGINGKISAGDEQPYFILKGIGFDRDVVRAYEYYVVDAQHFVILKNNLKFALIPNTIREISFIRTEKFRKIFYALYLNTFVDAGYGSYHQDSGKETNDLQNSLLLGYGAGIDFVTYYDIVIRLEFSINLMNETGFFLHFRAPI